MLAQVSGILILQKVISGFGRCVENIELIYGDFVFSDGTIVLITNKRTL